MPPSDRPTARRACDPQRVEEPPLARPDPDGDPGESPTVGLPVTALREIGPLVPYLLPQQVHADDSELVRVETPGRGRSAAPPVARRIRRAGQGVDDENLAPLTDREAVVAVATTRSGRIAPDSRDESGPGQRETILPSAGRSTCPRRSGYENRSLRVRSKCRGRGDEAGSGAATTRARNPDAPRRAPRGPGARRFDFGRRIGGRGLAARLRDPSNCRRRFHGTTCRGSAYLAAPTGATVADRMPVAAPIA